MLRKLSFNRDRNRSSQPGRKHTRHSKSLRSAILGIEQLELRALLAVDPSLTISAGQFFPTGNDADVVVPFRASFQDIFESVPETFSYSIDWGDGSTDSTGVTGDGTIEHMHANPTAPTPVVNDPLIGRIKKEHAFDEADEYTVTVTLADSQLDSDPAIVQTTVQVYDVDFGLEVTLDVSSPINEGDTASVLLTDDPLISEWTINWGDGTIETILGNPGEASHEYADDKDFNGDDTEFIITAAAKVSGTYKFAGSNTSVTVKDVEMTAEISADPSVNQGVDFDIELTADDPGDDVFQWIIDWGDLTGETTVGNPCAATHVYNTPGPYLITAFAVNDDGIQTPLIFHPITVTGQTQGTSLVDGTLFINGSTTGTGNDTATISVSGGNIIVNASMNGTNPFVAPISAVVDGIVVDLGNGSDILVTAPGINVPMTITGGDGNDLITAGGGADLVEGGLGVDIIYGAGGDDVLLGGDGSDDLLGGGGNDVLIGGNGNDMLFGQAGRDLLIGSSDEDLLSSGDGEDILVGGSTDYDSYDISGKANIDAIMAEWTSASSFNTRVSNLAAYLNASTITDDDSTDIIMGGSWRDLVFGDNNPGDGVTDLLALTPFQDVLVAITT
jgi:Ca2+-binding RTX toxin-like protein